jgi:hypothetical protein
MYVSLLLRIVAWATLRAWNSWAPSMRRRPARRPLAEPGGGRQSLDGSILRWLPRAPQPLSTNMLLRDEPDHGRLRHLVDRAFRR